MGGACSAHGGEERRIQGFGRKSRRMRWAGHVARMGERRGVYRVSLVRSEEKKPFGRPTSRWGIILK